MKQSGNARAILRRLPKMYPDAACSLDYTTPFELLVATMLSAQSTDAMVNRVTPRVFERWPTPEALAKATPSDVEEVIRSTGYFRQKAKSIIGAAGAIVEEHGGEVPSTLDELVELPGVGRKTANVVLGNAFGKNEGVVVDTHVNRVSRLLGLTGETDATKIERDLMEIVPRKDWTTFSHMLILHGRQVCVARKPRCADCDLADLCPSSTV